MATMLILGIIIVTTLTFFMASHNRNVLIANTLENNRSVALAISIHIDNYLEGLARTTATLTTAPLVQTSALRSNERYSRLEPIERAEEIDRLNERWLRSTGSDDPFLQEFLENPAAAFLREQRSIIPGLFGEIFLTNKYGALTASTGRLTTFAHGDKYWWLAVYHDGRGRMFFDDRGYDTSVGDFVLGVTAPVYRSGELIGVLKNNLRILELFDGIIESYAPLYEPGSLQIARSRGLVIWERGHPPLSTEVPAGILPLLGTETISSIYKDEHGHDCLVTVSPIVSTTAISESGFGGNEQSADQELGNKGENWVVVLRTPRRIIDALVWAQTKQFLLIGFLSIFFLAWLALAFVRRSTEPIIRLVELTEQVGRGDLNKQIEVSSKDEIGKLAESFNRMVISLRETMASRDELTAEIEKRIKVEEELKFLSTVDELTQLYNRRAFNDYLAKMTLHAKRYSEPLSIAMIDIDRFKEINDHHGHSVGDSVLRKLSRILLENIRSADILARWGGEEFILLMPNITAEEAHLAVERLRSLVGSVEFARGISLTVSIGITQLQADDSTDDLLKRVDAAQYKAKSLGRNNVQSL